jgi:MoaA/NifB/PqqE/SkfB family radical SAM enzyme
MENQLYRPEWTCGRYHKGRNSECAIIYNLLEGMVYFFEEDSAIIIRNILTQRKGAYFEFNSLKREIDDSISDNDFEEFIEQLKDIGLLLASKPESKQINNIRQQIGVARISQEAVTEKVVQEKLPFNLANAESAYMEAIEKDQIPFVVSIELTYSCNEKCIHCYNPGATRNDGEKSNRRLDEIDLQEYEKLFDDLSEMGVAKIILTGGDPFVRKDFWQLLKLIMDRDFAFDIYTNGILLLGRVDELIEFYPRSVGLSIYSAYEEIHDSITRIPNSLRSTLQTAQELVDFGIPLYFKCAIMSNNIQSYSTVIGLAQKFGAIPQLEISLIESLDGDFSVVNNLQVSGEALEIILRDQNIPLYVGSEAKDYGQVMRTSEQSFCGAGINTMNITPEGFVSPCLSFPTQLGNLQESSFKEIWSSSKELRNWQRITIKDFDECGKHSMCNYCNRCPGQSFIEFGSPLKISSSNCRIAGTRMKLAEKLKSGIDPLNGLSVQERLSQISVKSKPEFHRDNKVNYRNKPLKF